MIVERYLYELSCGKICVHPSGTLYGLTFDPRCDKAWKHLYKIKQRDESSKLLFLCKSFEDATCYWQDLPERWSELLQHIWPAHLSVIWKISKQKHLSAWHSWSTLGIRVPLYTQKTWFKNVLCKFPLPLPTTSVNISGCVALQTQKQIQKFACDYDVYCPDALWKDAANDVLQDQNSVELCASTLIEIIDSDRYTILREGQLKTSDLKYILSDMKQCKIGYTS